MVSAEKIEKDAKEIANELLTVFKEHFEDLVKEGNPTNIVNEIVEKTLVVKANKSNPNYPKKQIIFENCKVIKYENTPSIVYDDVGNLLGELLEK